MIEPRKVAKGSKAFGVLCILCLFVALALCLFGPAQSLRGFGVVGTCLREVEATFRDAETQWMVFVCLGVYFVTFIVLGRRQRSAPLTPALSPSAGERGILCVGRFWSLSNPAVWLAGGLLIATSAYAFNYPAASKSTEAVMLLAGIVLGKGAALWAAWGEVGRVTPCAPGLLVNGKPQTNGGQRTARPPIVISALVLLLLLACLWQAEGMQRFQYRGQMRWNGPWENPNLFGILMGVGIVLAADQILTLVTPRSSRSQFLRWLKVVFFFMAAGVMSVGLIKSYSRGAWVATLCGLGYLGWSWWRAGTHLTPALSPHPMGGEGESSSCSSCLSWLRRKCFPLCLVFLSLVVIGFWNYRQTEHVVARRAFSVGNVNDLSWRNRVAAWEGALQMMAGKPWLGYGWNQPEQIYDHYYRPAKVVEGMAIQLNDCFMLGMTLGLPALACFAVYLTLSLRAKCQVSGVKCHSSDSHVRNLSPVTRHVSLQSVCRAGAIVLLVGFWFDGGLFKLATGATFWILLELRREE